MRFFFCLLGCWLLCQSAQSQRLMGVTASGFVNKPTVKLITTPNGQPVGLEGIEDRPSFAVGGFVRANLSSWLAMRTELTYVNTGFRTRNPITDDIVGWHNFHYLQLNPMIGLWEKRGFSLLTGPSLNLSLGSDAEGQVVTITPQGGFTYDGRWIKTRTLLNTPPGQILRYGTTETFVVGWQVQLSYTHKRYSLHVNRQWPLQRMGYSMYTRNDPTNGRNDFYFGSWQFGFSYALFQLKSHLKADHP